MSNKLQIGEKVMSIYAECDGPYYLYKDVLDSSICLALPIKAYESCVVLDSVKTSRYTKVQIKTTSGLVGWIHTSCLKRV